MSHNLTSHQLAPIILRKRTAKEIRAGLSTPLRILTSPKTTLGLLGTLATLLIPGGPAFVGRGLVGTAKLARPRSIKGAIGLGVGIPTAVGVLSQSKTARGFLDPRKSVKRGRSLGRIIDDPGRAQDVLGIRDKTFKEKVGAGLKSAGIAGGALAIGLGAVAGAKKIIQARQKAPGVVTIPSPLGLSPVVTPRVAVSPREISPIQPPGATKGPQPLQNIIQISVS